MNLRKEALELSLMNSPPSGVKLCQGWDFPFLGLYRRQSSLAGAFICAPRVITTVNTPFYGSPLENRKTKHFSPPGCVVDVNPGSPSSDMEP